MFDRISETIGFFRRHWWPLSLLVWLFALPTLLVDLFSSPPEVGLDEQPDFTAGYYQAQIAVMLLFTPLSNVVLPLKIRAILDQQSVTGSTLITQGMSLWLRSFMTLMLMGIILFIGFALFILPGIYFMARLAYAPFYVAFHRQGALEAISSSMAATRDDQWSLLGVLLLFWSVVLMAHVMLANAFGDSGQVVVALQFMLAPLTALVTIAALRFYDLHHGTYQPS